MFVQTFKNFDCWKHMSNANESNFFLLIVFASKMTTNPHVWTWLRSMNIWEKSMSIFTCFQKTSKIIEKISWNVNCAPMLRQKHERMWVQYTLGLSLDSMLKKALCCKCSNIKCWCQTIFWTKNIFKCEIYTC